MKRFSVLGFLFRAQAQPELIAPVILALAVCSAPVHAATPVDCASVEDCVALVQEIAAPSQTSYGQVNDDERAAAERLRAFGPDAIPALVSMLDDPREEVRQIAGYALRDALDLDERHIPAIDRAMQRGDGWIAPALGRIGTPDAARRLVEQLVRTPEVDNQLEYALRLAGAAAVPFLVDLMRCERGCGDDLRYAVGAVFQEIGEHAAPAINDLLENARDRSLPPEVRAWNVHCIGAIGPAAASVGGELLAFADDAPELRKAVDSVLIAIRSTAAVASIMQRLREEPNLILLRDLAEMREAGQGAGAAVVPLLDHPDWRLRVGAARTLGFIGYAEAVDDLVPLLESEENWQLAWAAAQSLGRLQAESAIAALREASRSYWLPAVREEAALAVEKIRSKETYPLKFHLKNFPFEYFQWEHAAESIAGCTRISLTLLQEDQSLKLYPEYAAKQLKTLSYRSEDVDYEAMDRGVEQYVMVERTPDVALRVDGGWLVGGDHGEWGGELAFVADSGESTVLLNENVDDVYRLGGRYAVVTGVAHLGFNGGHVYSATRAEDGEWIIEQWRQLPGAPSGSALVDSEALVVTSYHGPTVLIEPDGDMQMAPCADE